MTRLVFKFLKGQGKYLLGSDDESPVNLPPDEELRSLYIQATQSDKRCGSLDTIERFSEGCKLKFSGSVPGWLQTNFLAAVQKVLDSAE